MTISVNFVGFSDSQQHMFKDMWDLIAFAKVWMESDHQVQLNRLMTAGQRKEILKETLKKQGYTAQCLKPDGTSVTKALTWAQLKGFAQQLHNPRVDVKATIDAYLNIVK